MEDDKVYTAEAILPSSFFLKIEENEILDCRLDQSPPEDFDDHVEFTNLDDLVKLWLHQKFFDDYIPDTSDDGIISNLRIIDGFDIVISNDKEFTLKFNGAQKIEPLPEVTIDNVIESINASAEINGEVSTALIDALNVVKSNNNL
jgi:hypothetical protein